MTDTLAKKEAVAALKTVRYQVPNYVTVLGEELYMEVQENGTWVRYPMTYSVGGWYCDADLSDKGDVAYHYGSSIHGQDIQKRKLVQVPAGSVVIDDWAPGRQDPWYTSAVDVMLGGAEPKGVAGVVVPIAGQTVLRVFVPYVQLSHETVYVIGNTEALGKWDIEKAIKMEHIGHRWFTTAQLELDETTEYKFVIKHSVDNFSWEAGKNRTAGAVGQCALVNAFFRYPYKAEPRFAGINVPVFSLNTANNVGCGEFLDLKKLGDFCKEAGIKVIQILPIFDTISTKTWVDSYPYGAITVFALHPMYLSLGAVKGVSKAILEELEKARKELIVDQIEIQYEKVVNLKLRLAKQIYTDKLTKNAEKELRKINKWVSESQEVQFWLPGYAVFKFLADVFDTVDYNTWGEREFYSAEKFTKMTSEERAAVIDDLFTNKSKKLTEEQHRELMFYAWIQMNLDQQLADAAQYCRSNGIILKGDVPIGVNRISVDTWQVPELFHMDTSTGAPPDAFSATGQNWGFPTYAWETMANDGFKWWTERFRQMGRYFDSFRIDHVLGWFRIWEIPAYCRKGNGRLGRFYPAMPIRWEWLEQKGIWDRQRLCEPWNPLSVIGTLITKEEYDALLELNFITLKDGFINLVDTEAELCKNLAGNKKLSEKKITALQECVVKLNCNRCMSYDKRHPQYDCHPIFCNTTVKTETYSFKALDQWQKDILRKMSMDYFYQWHDQIWDQTAEQRLPVIGKASDMLIIGEDLGLVAPVVPRKMAQHGLLGLRVQRMPADPQDDFWNTEAYDWMTVCTPATHDCPGIRSWLLDQKTAKKYWEQQLGRTMGWDRVTDQDCLDIVRKHLYSRSMISMFLFQDLICIDKDFWYKGDATKEDINHPDIAEWNWKYHMHVSIDELIERGFARKLKGEIEKSGRLV